MQHEVGVGFEELGALISMFSSFGPKYALWDSDQDWPQAKDVTHLRRSDWESSVNGTMCGGIVLLVGWIAISS